VTDLKKIEALAIIIVIVTVSTVGEELRRPFSLPISSSGSDQAVVPVSPLSSSFDYVSLFNSGTNIADYGWNLESGTKIPPITGNPSFMGEASLSLAAGTVVATDRNVVPNDPVVSFQFAVDSAIGAGMFAVTNSSGRIIASVSVSGDLVSVSSFAGHVARIFQGGLEEMQTWLLITGNLVNLGSFLEPSWMLQVFVDGTSNVFANLSAPYGNTYSGIELASLSGTVYFSDIIFASYEIGRNIPGYNVMEGYGEGSGSLASLLPPFDIISADIVLDNWSSVQYDTFSIQINVMNYTGATNPTSNGFFQLGIDLDPGGVIAPWHVNGKDAIAEYYPENVNNYFMPGFKTPCKSIIQMTIYYEMEKRTILFQIVDENITGNERWWNASMEYDGPPFCAAYTQLEISGFTPSGINSFSFNGSISNVSFGTLPSGLEPLNSYYMTPYMINTPNSWQMGFYDDKSSSYFEFA
jgi:hypothetical protein